MSAIREAVAETQLGLEVGVGHNSVASGQLKTLIERVERLEEEKAGVQSDIKDVYAEAKGNGFDTKVIRRIVAERKQDRAARQEFEALCDLYRQALGMD